MLPQRLCEIDASNQELFQAFLLDARTRNLRTKTIEGYSYSMKSLVKRAYSIEKGLAELDWEDVRNYILSLIDSGLSPGSINVMLRSWKSVYNGWVRDEFLDQSPFERIRLLKTDNKPKPVLTPDQLRLFLQVYPARGFVSSRNKVICLFLVDAMVRAGELVRLKLDDVDITGGSAMIRESKVRNYRVVPFSPVTAKELLKYMRFRKLIQSDHLFCKYERPSGGLMREDQIHKICRTAGEAIDLKVYPHLLRHTGATMYARAKGSLAVLQKILGHSSISTTEKYLHLSDEDVISDHNQFSPVIALI